MGFLLSSEILENATNEAELKLLEDTVFKMATINKMLGPGTENKDENLMAVAQYLDNSSPTLVGALCQANINNLEDYKMSLLNNKKRKMEIADIEKELPYFKYACVIKNIACITGYLLTNDIFRIECMEVLGLERNKGFGSKLLKAFIQECNNKKIKAIVLTPLNQYDFKDNHSRLIEFYKSFGFEFLKESFTDRDMYLKLEDIEETEIIKENNLYWKTLTNKIK